MLSKDVAIVNGMVRTKDAKESFYGVTLDLTESNGDWEAKTVYNDKFYKVIGGSKEYVVNEILKQIHRDNGTVDCSFNDSKTKDVGSFKSGQKVKIVTGKFSGQDATFITYTPSPESCMLQLPNGNKVVVSVYNIIAEK